MIESDDSRLAQICVQLASEREGQLTIIGGSFLIARNLLVTAAHVLENAKKTGYLGGEVIGERITLVRAGKRVGVGRVSENGFRGSEAEDVAFIEVIEKSGGLRSTAPLRLLNAGASQGSQFTAVGFPQRSKGALATADWLVARGRILTFVPRQGTSDVVQLDSQQMEQGFSGSPVYDLTRRGVVGMIVQRRRKRAGQWEQGYMLPTEVIRSLHPDIRSTRHERASRRVHHLERLRGAVPFIRRSAFSRKIKEFLNSNDQRVIVLRGFGGSGKTSIVRAFLERNDWHGGRSELVAACFSFYSDESIHNLLVELVELSDVSGVSDASGEGPAGVSLRDLENSLRADGRTWLLVLDGLEKLQLPGSPPAIPRGRLMESAEALRRFLRRVASGELETVWVIVTTRYSLVPDLGGFGGFVEEEIGDLAPAEARQLLRRLGLRGGDATLDLLPGRVGYHALTLDLAARYLLRFHKGEMGSLGGLPEFLEMGGDPDVEQRVARLYEILKALGSQLEVGEPWDLAILRVISLFRRPVEARILEAIARENFQRLSFPAERKRRPKERRDFSLAIQRLMGLRLVTEEVSRGERVLSVHPAIAQFFSEFDPNKRNCVRRDISQAYRLIAERQEPGRTLEPIEEAIFQEVQRGNVEGGLELYERFLGYRFFGWRLASPQRGLEVVSELIQGGGGSYRAEIDSGLYLKNLGMLAAASERFASLAGRETGERRAVALQNLSAVLVLQGMLGKAERMGREALSEAEIVADGRLVADSTVRVATALALQGKHQAACDMFSPLLAGRTDAERARSLDWPEFRFAWLLLRLQRFEAAEAVLKNVEEIAKRLGFEMIWARIVTAMAAVDLRRERLDEAGRRLDEVFAWLSVARDEEMYILGELLRGELDLKGRKWQSAEGHVRDGLKAALEGGYGLYRVDLRNLEARIAMERGEERKAKLAVEKALEGEPYRGAVLAGAASSGYYWGARDAKEIAKVEGSSRY